MRYVTDDPPPVTDLWLGAADDVIMRAKGVEFVDGSAPGFAAVVGAAPDNETAVRLAREMQEKMLYVFMAGHDGGVAFGEQLAEEDVQLGWDTRLVPFGKEVYSQIFSIGFATRAAMAFGGVQPGDFERILAYNKSRVFAFVLALGEVTDEWYATAAGAISYGFPTIATSDIPQILPTGVCTYEHVVSNITMRRARAEGHRGPRSQDQGDRGARPRVLRPGVRRRARPQGGHVRRDGRPEDARPSSGCERSTPPRSRTARSRSSAPRSTTSRPGTLLPLGIVVDVAGRKMQSDFESVLERQIHHLLNYAEGILHMGQRDLIWLRISESAKKAGLKFEHLGEILHAKLLDDFDAIVDKVQVTIYTDEEKVLEWREKALAVVRRRATSGWRD